MLKRKILWEPLPDVPVIVSMVDFPEAVDESHLDWDIEASPPILPSRNGHRVLKVRDLESYEKGKILNELFLPNNGMIKPDLCVQFKAQKLSAEVAIFQVTGYVSTLHNKVARGIIRVQDQRAYEDFIRAHRNQWSTYNSDKYRAMRQATNNQHRQPQFAAFPARKLAVV